MNGLGIDMNDQVPKNPKPSNWLQKNIDLMKLCDPLVAYQEASALKSFTEKRLIKELSHQTQNETCKETK